ncbi:hypothetical protein Daus18300_007217 [Diaporthe australafricana]|uniref:Peptidase S8/S53 domain-containing protein n=1 Tax=Diaporthe australafricana TaxID=127596 RepID=A0ABR3WPD9_9PEZI
MATIRTEDASDRLHLSLLSSPKDYNNANTGTYTYLEEAQGQGTWIVIINTGYNWELFPEEFGTPGDPRPIVLWNVPEAARNRDLEESEIVAGLHWPPDDNTDYGEPFEGVPEGHGTQTAILAGGMRTGAARRAGLYLIKAGGAVLNTDEDVVEEDICALSLILSLNHVVEKLRDHTLPPGKTVVVIDTLWNIHDMRTDGLGAEQNYKEWYDQVDWALEEIDRLGGVLVSVAAGNEGRQNPPGETGDFMPSVLSQRVGSPLVIVGAVNRGKDILLPDLSVEQKMLQSGTTFSAAIVAGQAACMLSDSITYQSIEWRKEDSKGNTVANRVKKLLAEEGKGSFQRVRKEEMLDPTSTWGQVNNNHCPDA